MADLAIAKTILEQLGGRRFTVMTGAKNFLGSEEEKSLSFTLPRNFAKDGINRVKITLDPTDTYTVEFGKITYRHPYKYAVVETVPGVYDTNLQSVFTKVTGLDTHL